MPPLGKSKPLKQSDHYLLNLGRPFAKVILSVSFKSFNYRRLWLKHALHTLIITHRFETLNRATVIFHFNVIEEVSFGIYTTLFVFPENMQAIKSLARTPRMFSFEMLRGFASAIYFKKFKASIHHASASYFKIFEASIHYFRASSLLQILAIWSYSKFRICFGFHSSWTIITTKLQSSSHEILYIWIIQWFNHPL